LFDISLAVFVTVPHDCWSPFTSITSGCHRFYRQL